MKFVVLTLFPDMIRDALSHSVMGRAIEAGLIQVEAVDIRDYANNKHFTVDDYPFGGGAGMVIQAPPVYAAYQAAIRKFVSEKAPVLFMSPAGKVFDQRMAERLAKEPEIVILCGHYEGIDQRVLDLIVTEEVSAGDFVLTGGELPAMMIMDAVSRLVDGVLGNQDSAVDESFSGMFLEYPQYTRPREWQGMEVPEVLLSGHHAKIEQWREEKAIEATMKKRPDLLRPEEMSKRQKKVYQELISKENKEI